MLWKKRNETLLLIKKKKSSGWYQHHTFLLLIIIYNCTLCHFLFIISHLWHHVEAQKASYTDRHLRVLCSDDHLYLGVLIELTLAIRFSVVYRQQMLCALYGFCGMTASVTDVVTKAYPRQKAGVIDGFNGVDESKHLYKRCMIKSGGKKEV